MSKIIEPNIRFVEEDDWLQLSIYINDKLLKLKDGSKVVLYPKYIEDFEDEDVDPDMDEEDFCLYVFKSGGKQWIPLTSKGRPLRYWERILKILCMGGYYHI
jgi:hypothetical protein